MSNSVRDSCWQPRWRIRVPIIFLPGYLLPWNQWILTSSILNYICTMTSANSASQTKVADSKDFKTMAIWKANGTKYSKERHHLMSGKNVSGVYLTEMNANWILMIVRKWKRYSKKSWSNPVWTWFNLPKDFSLSIQVTRLTASF